MRGAAYVRCRGDTEQDFKGPTKGHVLDYQARQQRKVVRATFTA